MKFDRVKRCLSSYRVIVVFMMLCIISSYKGQDYAMLSFLILFQIAIGTSIFQTCKLYFKTRTGVFVKGQLIESTEVKDSEEVNYSILIEFSYPEEENKHLINFQSNLNPTKSYTIWVDQQAPDNSVVMEKVSNDLSKIVLWSLFFFGLFYIDYLYVLKIIGQ